MTTLKRLNRSEKLVIISPKTVNEKRAPLNIRNADILFFQTLRTWLKEFRPEEPFSLFVANALRFYVAGLTGEAKASWNRVLGQYQEQYGSDVALKISKRRRWKKSVNFQK